MAKLPVYQPTIPTSLLGLQDDESNGGFNNSFNNVSLKSGVISKCYDIEDDENLSKLSPEYDVVVIEQDADRGVASTIYKNCIAVDSLGAIGDFFEFKRRVPTKNEFKNDLDGLKQDGSFVTILCLDGINEKAIIVGGINHPKRKTTLTKSAGTHMEGEFNGVNIQINKDGEFTLTFNSPSDNKRQYKTPNAQGSFFKILKDGSIKLSDNNKEMIEINKTNKTVSIVAEKDISITTDENINLKSTKNISCDFKDLLMKASGKAGLDFTGEFSVKSGADFKIDSKTLLCNVSTKIELKCPSIKLSSQKIELGNGGTPALIQTTLYLGKGNLGLPVVSSAIGPYSSVVKIK